MPFDVSPANNPDPFAFLRVEYKSLQLFTDLLGRIGLTDRRYLAERAPRFNHRSNCRTRRNLSLDR